MSWQPSIPRHMQIEVQKLTDETESAYAAFLSQVPNSMIYHSLEYRNFLRRILPGAQDDYLIAFRNHEAVGIMPVFSLKGPQGTIVNSLPFYGSHGSFITHPGDAGAARSALLAAFQELCSEKAAVCSTIIEPPIRNADCEDTPPAWDHLDDRIGQITELPAAGSLEEAESRLMEMIHQKTRNMVRKGFKGGFQIGHSGGQETLHALHALHDENLRRIGGIPKSLATFEAIAGSFLYDRDYRVYTAKNSDGMIVSGLLVLYFNQWVEYFVPASLEAYRSEQPLSALIFRAMADAILERQSTLWNWGGTWLSQSGVYLFKSRWGTRDFPYKYYVKEYPEKGRMTKLSSGELLAGYPHFFTIPFSQLQS